MKAFIAWLEGFGVSVVWILLVIGAIFIYIAFVKLGIGSSRVFGFVLAILPLWLPFVMFYLFFEMWLLYVRRYYDVDNGRVTLEIKLPQEIMKSPEAMELIFTQLYQTATPDNHVQTYWDGKHPPVFGLEIVSRGGDVKFYMSVPRKKFKHITESQLYAQYPGIEVSESKLDYTAEIPWDPDNYFYFSFHYNLRQPDAYPIKTYFDFGLHTLPKEEEKTDPITVMLDILGSIGPGEHIWVQFLVSAHKKQNFKTGSLRSRPYWTKDVQKEIDSILEKAKARGMQSEDETVSLSQLTDGERGKIQALERSMSKYVFTTNIRAMYVAKSDVAVPAERMGLIAGIFREYDDVNRNQFGINWRTDTDWPWWQDIGGKRTRAWKYDELYDYKKRTMDRRMFEGNIDYLFTTEELATIYHFPGKVALTPTLGRIPSARSEAPGNLPTG